MLFGAIFWYVRTHTQRGVSKGRQTPGWFGKDSEENCGFAGVWRDMARRERETTDESG